MAGSAGIEKLSEELLERLSKEEARPPSTPKTSPELVHLPHRHHTSWARVERVLPDFALRKAWLAENGQLAGI
jgi:uncharacterized protein with von Willebrand factor type A (vWA) domain